MRIFLAGASGAVGRRLIPLLLAEGHSVTGTTRSAAKAAELEAHGATLDALYDRIKTTMMLETDRSHALRAAIFACAKGGTVSIPGVYGGFLDKFPLGGAFAKGLTLKMGQTNVHRYLPRLLNYISEGKIDPSFVVTHRIALDDTANGYKTFHEKKDECIKVVLKPHGMAA